jgi:hypothetical protein
MRFLVGKNVVQTVWIDHSDIARRYFYAKLVAGDGCASFGKAKKFDVFVPVSYTGSHTSFFAVVAVKNKRQTRFAHYMFFVYAHTYSLKKQDSAIDRQYGYLTNLRF